MFESMSLVGLSLLAWQDFGGGGDAGDVAGAIIGLICYLGMIALSIAVAVLILLLNYRALDRLPPPFRQMEPWQVFLLLIPCFNVIWVFFVYTKVPRSLAMYYHSIGRHDVGDAGEQLGLWLAITSLICPGISLILLIVYLMKIHELTKQLPM